MSFLNTGGGTSLLEETGKVWLKGVGGFDLGGLLLSYFGNVEDDWKFWGGIGGNVWGGTGGGDRGGSGSSLLGSVS